MDSSDDALREQLTAEELIRSFLSPDVDLLELERMQSDLILHYMRPEGYGYPSQERAVQVLDHGEMVIKILRQIGDYGKGAGVRRW